MSKIFGPQDVAVLVATFPSLLREGSPTLIHTHAKDALISFDHVGRKLQSLLSDGNARVARKDLSVTLNLDEDVVGRLLVHFLDSPCRSHDGRLLIPRPEVDAILATLKRDADSSVIDMVQWSQRSDIDSDDLLHLVDSDTSGSWKLFIRDQTRYVCSKEFMRDAVAIVSQTVRDAGSDVVDLSSKIENAPSTIVMEIAEEAVPPSNGEFKSEGTKVLFVPADHGIVEANKLSKARADKVHNLVQEIERASYCIVDVASGWDGLSVDDIVEQVLAEYKKTRPDDPDLQVVAILPEDSSKEAHRVDKSLLITTESLRSHINASKELIVSNFDGIWRSNNKEMSPTEVVRQVHQLDTIHVSGVSKLLISSEHMHEFEAMAQTKIEEMERKDNELFVHMINDRLIAPVQLYADGIETIKDPALKQNLQTFVLEYCQTHYAKSIGKDLESKGLLTDKSKNREIEKFQVACQQARTFDELCSGLAKLTKKLKIPDPSPEAVHDLKKRILKDMLRHEVQEKTVASVVLQNTIWILLAQKSPGLFISAGKDTTRMIKQYASIGDAETSQNLLLWRDLAKSSQADSSTLSEMRSAARSAFQSLYPPPSSSSPLP